MLAWELEEQMTIEGSSQQTYSPVFPHRLLGMYTVKDANTLNLRANGDWPTLGKCVILEPKGIWYANNPLGESDDVSSSQL